MIKSTGRFKVKSVFFNDGHFAIASGNWDGQEKLSTACRWHAEDGIGYPQTFGKPQWMLLPDPSVEIEESSQPNAPIVKLGFGKKTKPFYSVELIDADSGLGVHTFTGDVPFGPVSVGDFISVPQARFPDDERTSNGRVVTRVEHIFNEVDGQVWHSTMLTVALPDD